MLREFLLPTLDELGIRENIFFQQDGATAHTAGVSMGILRTAFRGRLISQRGNIPWPPRSPDLTGPDFFLWGYLKSKVYANKPQTIDQLKENIRNEIASITPDILKKVMDNAAIRVQCCIEENGGHLKDVIFKN